MQRRFRMVNTVSARIPSPPEAKVAFMTFSKGIKSSSRTAIVAALAGIATLLGLSILCLPHPAALNNSSPLSQSQLPGDVFAGGYPAPTVTRTASHPFAPAANKSNDERGRLRLGGTVPHALAQATKLENKHGSEPLTLTIVLNRDDQAGFDNFLQQVQDPKSELYRRYLTPREQAERFGPSQQDYDSVQRRLRSSGFTLVEGSANRLTLTVRGTRRIAAQLFGVEIADYRIGANTFYANDREPSVPAELAPHIQAVIGLSDLAKPDSSVQEVLTSSCLRVAIDSAQLEYQACLARHTGEFVFAAYFSELCNLLFESEKKRSFERCAQGLAEYPGRGGNGPNGSGGGSSQSPSSAPSNFKQTFEQAATGPSSLAKPVSSITEAYFSEQCESAAHLAAPQNLCYQHCMQQDLTTACGARGNGDCYGYLKLAEQDLYNYCISHNGKLPGDGANNPPDPPAPGSRIMTSGLPPNFDSLSSRLSMNQPAAATSWLGVDGTGQTIGLLEFDTFNQNDIRDYLALAGYPATNINRLSQVHVNGGAQLGPEESEVLIDIIAVMSNARGAQVVVYDAPFSNIRTSFQTLFNRMISDGVTVISNSWVYCEDQTSAADAQSIDSILASAAAAGITVLNSTGDFGSACVNGSGNTISVPADSPHATAVGGTSLTTGPALTYASELFWNSLGNTPPSGAGGFGVSRFFSRPTYQNGFTSSPRRSVPDVSVNGDPSKGIEICQADAGGCPTGASYGGTSLSAPIWAAFVALLNQAQGQNLGELNPLLYPLGNSDAFHSAASMGSDFQHVGLGSPNLNLIHRALSNKTPGPVSATVSEIKADPAGALADGNAEAFIVVRLRDADGHTISGKAVTLTGNAGSHAIVTPASGISNVANGAVVFSIKDSVPEFVTFRATDTTDGVVLQTQVEVVFVAPPAAAGGISATPTTVNANGSDATTITVTLQDAHGNPAPGKIINLSQGNGASIISATTATTDATGKVQFSAVSSKAESVTYTATDVTDLNLPVPGSATVNFVNASGFCAGTNSYRFGTAAPGYAVTTFAGNFPLDCFTGIGPFGLGFNRNGSLFVGDFQNNNLYAFGQQGGVAGPATLVGQVTPSFGLSAAGIAFTKDGHFYAILANGNNLVEVNPATASVIRNVAHFGGVPNFGLAVDPLSGDLFVSGDDGISRVSNFASGPGTVTLYTNGSFDGIAFATDGTLYAAAEFSGGIFRINGTNASTPGTAAQIAILPGHPDGIAFDLNPANASKPFLYVNRNDGTITRIDTSLLPNTPETPCATGCADIYTGGSRGDFVTVGPSGCLYATQSDRIIRITKADGTCSLIPTNGAPQIALTPEHVQPSLSQGSTVTLTAQVKNAGNPADIPVTLLVSGANATARLVRTDAIGKATITYTGRFSGDDIAFASAEVAGTIIFSNDSTVTWTPGKHSTFLTLNLSPSSGDPHKPLSLAAMLVDVSATPNPSPIAGQSVSFTIAGQTCAGTTDATGTARCSITTNSGPGTFSLSANFVGTSTLLSSTASKTVDLIDTPAPPTTTVQFDSANYTISEGCAALSVNVTRTGDTSVASSVEVSTADGTASERSDYTTALGTVRFAPGETQKSFSLTVTSDSYAEGDETFNLALSNVAGTGFGALSTAVVTIVDAGARSGNVIDDSREFVCQHYHDFLNRQSDQAGEDFWTQNIEQCGSNAQCRQVFRVETSAAFFLSIEFKETGYFVIRTQKAAFGNSKSTPRYQSFIRDQREINEGVVVGQSDWQQKIESNKQSYLAEFISRPEFVVLFPQGMTAAAYVDKLFANAGVTPTTDERGTAINAYGAGDAAGRAAAVRSVVESGSVFNAEYNAAFVLMQYFGYLRRNPDAAPDGNFAGYDFWLAKLDSFSRPSEDMRDDTQAFARVQKAEMVRAFIESLEYRKRFGPP